MESEEQEKSKIVHTFSDDVVGALGENQGGGVRDLIKAEEEHSKEKQDYSPTSLKNKIFVLIGVVLILASVGGIAYTMLTKQTSKVYIPITYRPIVYADRTENVNVDGLQKDLVGATIFWQLQERKFEPGKLEALYLVEDNKAVELGRFFALFKAHLDKEIFELLSPNYSLGVLSLKDSSKHIFLLISAKSFQDIFPYMRKWEPYIFADLYGMFGIEITDDNRYLLEKGFSDGILQNKNARILFDANGEIVLAYVYLDEHHILISDSEAVVEDIALRMKSNTESK